MIIRVDEKIRLELLEDKHAESIFHMVNTNRNHLRSWLPFVDSIQSIEYVQDFVKETTQRNNRGNEFAFVVFYENNMVGRVGVYQIDVSNKIAEIGYWIVESAQGYGIITKSCKALVDFCFTDLRLNRIEIKCGIANGKSNAISKRLNFTHEGVMRQAELLNGDFIDLNLYSLLKNEKQTTILL
jgi:ribosomal-protein-serine acetyltransferase